MPDQESQSSGTRAIQMVMSDVDGTLVTPEKDLTERARQAVFQLREQGIRFTIISSRPPFGLRSLIRELRLDLPVVAFNGAMLVTPDEKALQEHYLPAELIPDILACLRKYDVSPRLYTPDCWLIESRQQPHAEHEACTIEMEPTIVQDFKPYFDRILKLTGVSDDHEAVAECRKAMQEMLAGRASAVRSQPYYLDITHQLADKGKAVEMMARAQQLPQSEIAVIGDMPSDLPMFRAAGYCIAMGNASDPVKKEANAITASNADEGFAKAMEQLTLRQGVDRLSTSPK